MSLNNRFSAIDKAIITATGNSLVICGSATITDANTSDMMTSGGSTTRDWASAGSFANLSILEGSTILYAELIWYSTVKSNVPGALDVRSIEDNSITFTTPLGTSQITPQHAESFTAGSGNIDRFRSTDVTNVIKNSLGGKYTVSAVPTSLPATGLSYTRAGWSLIVVYRNDAFNPKKILFSSGIENANTTTPLQVTMTGFTTSTDESDLRGNIFLACANGQPLKGTEILKIGPSFAQLTTEGNPVSTPNPNPGTAPNNPNNSFFTGQINICTPNDPNVGLIDISGTNGTNNHDAFVPTQVVGARNKWDLTNVDFSNSLVANQNQLAIQVTESGSFDGVMIVGVGTEVNAVAPDITVDFKAYDPDGLTTSKVTLGESLVYSAQIKNSGNSAANNVILSTLLDPSCSFVSNSLKVNGAIIEGADIVKGVNVGCIDPTGVTTVLFNIRVNSLPESKTIKAFIDYRYEFVSGSGSPVTINYGKSKVITIEVVAAQISVVKTASAQTANVGDRISYTINVKNIGTVSVKDVLFQDIVSKYSSFVTGTVAIDGVLDPSLNPNSGLPLPNIPAAGTVRIVFSVDIISLPPSTIVNNNTKVTFSYSSIYSIDEYPFTTTKTITSNILSIQIHFIDIVGERCTSNDYPSVGDTVTYNLKLTNIGNLTATNVEVAEPPVYGETFVAGTVKINGVPKPALNPFSGFTIDSIPPQQAVNIQYDMLVNAIDPARVVENIARIPFKYQIQPGSQEISAEKDSNKVTTLTSFVKVNILETVDKPYATIGDTLYYTASLTNVGNIDALNTIFSSSIQSDTSFIPGTVAINGVIQPGYNPNTGFSVGTICSDNTVVVTYQAKVNKVPVPNVVYNSSELVYSYKPDPTGSAITTTVSSNIVQTIINVMSFTITKTVDTQYAVVGDFMSYSTYIVNTGTVSLRNVKFGDNISDYLIFYPQTVFINGINYPGLDVKKGFDIGDIHPGDTARISFGVQVKAVPPAGIITNKADIVYTYQVNPDQEVITDSTSSNEVTTVIVDGNLKVTKSVDKTYATLGDPLSYSFNVSNIGNVTASKITFVDTIPAGALFVPGSVIINGMSKPTYDPQVGFSLGALTAGQVVSLSLKATVNTVPIPNTIINRATATFDYVLNPGTPPLNKTITSNNVTTVVNLAVVNLTKVVDKPYAAVGEALSYTVTAGNAGTVDLYNILFKDLIPNGAAFLPDSVVIDNVSRPGLDPNVGFTLDTITSGGNRVVSYKATVTSVPTPNTIINSANLTYKFKINPSGSELSGSKTSNLVTTVVNQAAVTNTKTVDKLYATVLNTLTYSSVITNNGNVALTNTVFADLVPPSTTFQVGSVTINGIPQPTFDPLVGFTLGTITPLGIVTIVFKVTVSSLPPDGIVLNTSNLAYQYKVDPALPPVIGSVTSNTVTTHINVGSLTIAKTANRNFARLADVVKYSFVITNTGNTLLKAMSFIDTIQTESSFNGGTVFVNGVNRPDFNPNSGFVLDNIPVGQYTILEFTVTVNSIPPSGKLLNTGSTTFSFNIDPTGNPITKTQNSNQTTVTVNATIVSAAKAVDKEIAKIGDILNYSFILKNGGNTPAVSVLFEDVLNSNIAFNTGSVLINGTPSPASDPNLGFALPDLSAGSTTTVSFKATVLTRPADNTVKNFATINYEYKVDPQQPFIPVIITTNTVTTYIAAGEITVTKIVDKIYATVLNTLNYTVNIKNTGSVNALNLTFKDIVPQSTSFFAGSVLVNGIAQSGVDPNTGFKIPDLLPNAVNTVTFAVNVDSLPTNGKVVNTAAITFSYRLTPSDPLITDITNSNSVTTFINLGKLVITKAVDKAFATLGDVLSYSITLKNTGSVPCLKIFFQDILQAEAAFNTGTVIVNGVSKPTYNPTTGFNLDDMAPNVTTTVTFTVTVKALPANSIISNTAVVDYSYPVDPNNPLINTSGLSNTVTTQINVGRLTATKEVNLSYATLGDTLVYSVNVTNAGNIAGSLVNFRDVIPTGLTFIPDSVTINNLPKPGFDPFASFTLGTINPGDSVLIKFKATVTSVPTPSLIANTANVTFTYRINPLGPDIISEVNSNTVTTQLNLGQLTLTKSVDKVYATLGDVLTYTVVVTNTGNVEATQVIFTDNLQPDIRFNTGSVLINGQSYPDYDPMVGFPLGTLPTLGVATVAFKTTVVHAPLQVTVLNNAVATFNYKIDPSGQEYTKSTPSNTVLTYIRIGALSANKVVDLQYATLGDTLNYTIVVKSTGNTGVKQLFFADTLSNGATFKTGTVIVDDIPQPTYDPIAGFALPDLLSGNTSTVKFMAQVTSVPVPPVVTNYAAANGVYKVDPAGPNYQVSTTSNTVSTEIRVGNVSVVKSVDKAYAKISDTLTYSSVITNAGNVTASSVKFLDNLQAEISFIGGTVRINGVINPLLDPSVGFPLNNLGPSQTTTVEFEVKINTLPVPPQVQNSSQVQFIYQIDPSGSTITKTSFSNTVTTNVSLGQLTVIKLVDKTIATVGDVLTFTITLTNTGNSTASNVTFFDTPSVGAAFNAGSVKINNVPQPTFDPTTGFSLGDIGIGNVTTVVFTATVTSVPPTNKVTNQATVNFKYIVDPKQPPYSATTYSNTTTTNIALGNLSVVKSVDKQFATLGGILTYTIVITNIGNIDATNVVFLDATPNNAIFVIGSVIVNVVSQPTYNPSAGFALNTMKPGEIITVLYHVQVVK